MADIFISYSRDDRARAATIAAALEAEGYSVWWDPEIRPGETWDAVIDRELRAARCVIVAWSAKSVGSKWVRAEATEADSRQALLPVRLDATRLPVPFNLIQTEDLVAWTGDRTANDWQRIMLQVAALCGERTPSSSPLPSGTRSTSPLPSGEGSGVGSGHITDDLKSPHPYPLPIRGGEQVAASASSSTTVLTLSAVAVLGAAWWLGAADRSPVITTTVVLAALAFLLFRLAEDDLSPGVKAIARRWMLPVEGKVQVSAIEAFNGMFEAVFGRKHFSWFCVWRSVATSFFLLLMLTFLLDRFVFGGVLMKHFSSQPSMLLVINDLISFVVPCTIANLVGDYASLLETRLLLQWAKKYKRLIWLLLLDIVLTGAIFVGLNYAFFIGAATFTGGDPLGDSSTASNAIIQTAFAIFFEGGLLLEYLVSGNTNRHPATSTTVVIYASLATAYLTSIWLWLALIFTPVVRLIVWSRTTGLTALGRVLDAERKPMVALGYVTALLILACGGLIWGAGRVLTMLG